MAREGITRTQVFDAADAISKSGSAPTVAAIRAKLGTGSYTTITQHLRDWKAQATAADNDADIEVPEEVTDALQRAAALVWKSARDHFEAELTAIRKEAEQRITATRAELTSALDEIALLEANKEHVDDLEEELAFHKAEYRKLQITLAEHDAELRLLRTQVKEQNALLMNLTASTPKPTPAKKPKGEPKPAAEIDDKTQPLTL